jgi:rubredoxin
VNVVKAAELERRKCPNCGAKDVRRSQLRGLVERGVLKMVGVRASRCESCDWRYYGIRGMPNTRRWINRAEEKLG